MRSATRLTTTVSTTLTRKAKPPARATRVMRRNDSGSGPRASDEPAGGEQTLVQSVDIRDEAIRSIGGQHAGSRGSAQPLALRRDRPSRASIVAARATASSTGTSRPVSPSVTTSGTPPTSVDTTARPAAMASMRATGEPSLRDVNATTSRSA